jgi:hypothetical protein
MERKAPTRPVNGGEEEPSDEREMVDEEAELHRVALPVGWPMEG